MNNLFSYAFESGLILAVLYGLYWLLFRKETYFQFNRIYLLSIVLISCVLPFVNVSLFDIKSDSTVLKALSEFETSLGNPNVSVTEGLTNNIRQSTNWQLIILAIYLLGVVIILARAVTGIVRITILKKRGKRIDCLSYSIVYINQQLAPFSFFKAIFINETLIDSPQRSVVINHELIHIKQCHTFDKLAVEVFQAIFWFNPFIWLIKNSLTETHEYLADSDMIYSETNISEYQSLLLGYVFDSSPLLIASSFSSMIKSRIMMMSRARSSLFGRLKTMLILPVAFFIFFIFSFSSKSSELSSQNLAVKSQLLQEFERGKFPGGEVALKRFIEKNTRYPKLAQRKGIQGTVSLWITVDESGKIIDAEAKAAIMLLPAKNRGTLTIESYNIVGKKPRKGIPTEYREEDVQLLCDEAIRVANMMDEKWIPAMHNGHPTKFQRLLPVKFILQ